MGPPGNRGSWGPCPCPNSKKAYEQGHLMGPPTDRGPSDSARVSKWSVRPCSFPVMQLQNAWKFPQSVQNSHHRDLT
ncbi:unnamed protein product [Staurois parvus]|uniref:Uncharacterized protein n=1 Tax=Staurois parvus TaxID=386267 RepID=A0ABN9AN57_9NEOB|nr:unnamed protein product [Staurois parvus]